MTITAAPPSPTSPSPAAPRLGAGPIAVLPQDTEVLERLVNTFADAVPGVSEAVLAWNDGSAAVSSSGLDPSAANSLAAMAMGLARLGSAAADRFGGGRMSAVTVNMDRAQVLVSGCGDDLLAAVLGVRADAADVAVEMHALAGRIGAASGCGHRS